MKTIKIKSTSELQDHLSNLMLGIATAIIEKEGVYTCTIDGVKTKFELV